MEIGNMLWGNSRGTYYVNRDLQYKFVDLLELIGCDSYGLANNMEDPERNKWGGITTKDIIVRPYYWGDDVDEAILPNFEYKPLGLKIDWYKYPLRDSYSNMPFTEDMLHKIILDTPRKIYVSEKYKELFKNNPTFEKECVGEDYTETWTVRFTDSYEMDIKICGVQFEEGADNRPWCEAVLFYKGHQVAVSEPEEDIYGDWCLEYAGHKFTVKVFEKKEKRDVCDNE